jgi:Ca2+-binding EF-hand superfamily protein
LAQAGHSAAKTAQPLSRAEFMGQMDAEFRSFDANSNGTVLPAEIAAAQRKTAGAEALRQNQAIFASLDKDRSGGLSAAEFAGLVNPAAIAVDPVPLITQLDTDRGGVVTLVEYRISTQANFDRINTDRDGVVTVSQMRAARIVR